ncbi:hypothetical protein F2Q69_00022451 [Brassica cretica]|uniref:Uncharacterized protein n=1 Tax=Brassica cretica TaxID=69181 RepID=A0A8S9Q6J6_BRACR|nr:hypothetical protein F2Q69_00022451 [Brassica cretica]
MVAIVILRQDENGNLYDQDGHLSNVTCQKLDAQGNVIPDTDAKEAAQPVEEAARPKSLADYNRPDEYYANKSAIRLPEIQKVNFELKPQYYTLVSQIPYSGIENLGTQVRKLEMQVVQTGDTVKRQEALAREAGVEKAKHHVNAIIDDDLWQVVKYEKLGEGDFKVESSMSFGGSLWCRPMSMDGHRSTDHDEDQSMDYSKHRSTSSAESTPECSAVRIMTHEEFSEKNPHPPSPFYVKIDRPHEPAVDRQRETDID